MINPPNLRKQTQFRAVASRRCLVSLSTSATASRAWRARSVPKEGWRNWKIFQGRQSSLWVQSQLPNFDKPNFHQFTTMTTFLFWMLPPPLRVLAGSVAVPVVGAAPAPCSYKNFWKIRGRAPWPSKRSSSCHHLHQINHLIITLITDIVFVGKGASHGWSRLALG